MAMGMGELVRYERTFSLLSDEYFIDYNMQKWITIFRCKVKL